jgi:hypothetical protein
MTASDFDHADGFLADTREESIYTALIVTNGLGHQPRRVLALPAVCPCQRLNLQIFSGVPADGATRARSLA